MRFEQHVAIAWSLAMTLFGSVSVLAQSQSDAGLGQEPHPFASRPAPVGGENSSVPYRYSVATEPPREPRRASVPCAPYARETDGTTTCIGIDSRISTRGDMARTATPAKRQHSKGVRTVSSPAPIEPAPSDPRHYTPYLETRTTQGSGGLLSAIGSFLSR